VIEQPPGDALPIAEIAMLHRKGADLRPGNTYLAVSSLSNASIEELQGAGVDYPDWVRQKYLELPSDLSPQVTELAKQVTAEALTPFDKAVALEVYSFLSGARQSIERGMERILDIYKLGRNT